MRVTHARPTGSTQIGTVDALRGRADEFSAPHPWLTSGGPLDAPESLAMGATASFESITHPVRSYGVSTVLRPGWHR